jgi:hypothetical protein
VVFEDVVEIHLTAFVEGHERCVLSIGCGGDRLPMLNRAFPENSGLRQPKWRSSNARCYTGRVSSNRSGADVGRTLSGVRSFLGASAERATRPKAAEVTRRCSLFWSGARAECGRTPCSRAGSSTSQPSPAQRIPWRVREEGSAKTQARIGSDAFSELLLSHGSCYLFLVSGIHL